MIATCRRISQDWRGARHRPLDSRIKHARCAAVGRQTGRINRHIIPLIGKRTVKDFTTIDAGKFQRDVIAGKSAADVKTKLRGRAIVTGGKGTAARTMGLLQQDVSRYAVSEGYRPDNPCNGIVRPKDGTHEWRMDDAGYRHLGKCLAAAEADGHHWQRVLASRAATLTGCRLDEIEGLLKTEVDSAGMALRLGDTKTGKSIRPGRVRSDRGGESSFSQIQIQICLPGNNYQRQTPHWPDPMASEDSGQRRAWDYQQWFAPFLQLDRRGSWLFAPNHQGFGWSLPCERDRRLHP